MNRNFFEIRGTIYISDILKILNVSKKDFLEVNRELSGDLLEFKIMDFVSFSNLENNKLSFFTSNGREYSFVSGGICIIEKSKIHMLNKEIIKIPFFDPKLGFSKVLNNYFNKINIDNLNQGIHSSAIIDKGAFIGRNVSVGPFTVIENGVVLDDNTYIDERVKISYNCRIGKNCHIGSGVNIECAVLNENVVVFPNTVIGKSGFGFIPQKSETTLTPHIGGVEIGRNTNIGSNCTIDRGLIEDTIIGDFVMIDNQVHIAHNCIIEDYCIVAGQVGLSGSVHLKKNVVMGGDVSIRDNITIGENSLIAGASKIFNNFPSNSKIGGNPAQDLLEWKKMIASQRLSIKRRKKN